MKTMQLAWLVQNVQNDSENDKPELMNSLYISHLYIGNQEDEKQ